EEEKARIQRVIKEHKEKDEREKAGARARELEIPAAAGPRVKVEELLKAPKTPEAFGEMKKKGLFEKIKGFFARKAEKAAKTEKAESKERLEPISAKAPVKERAKAVKTAMEEKAREKGKRKEAKAKKGGIKAPKKNMFDRFVETAKPGPMAKYKKGVPAAIAKKGEEGVSFGKFFGWDIFKIIKERTRPSEAIGKKTELSESTILMETERRRKEATVDVKQQIEKITATALTEEAKRIRSILEKRKALRIYQPTFFGALANVMTKRISLFLLDHFPDFFKGLYQQLRLANIKILSNTYVNMMVFSVIFSMILGFVGFGLAFSFLGLPWVVVVVRTLFMAFIMGILMFAVFYAYPSSKAKTRRMSINTNMPFAVNHMAAVASSGVPPTKMFKLISESEEYKEIAVECEKIVNYIEIFGYDVLTAIKSVAVTTPSPAFKEFFNGMVSTTQSGGDVKSYLAQKADEAMLAYRLERKKYTETIATYSDIYTGILIAAPLFFVAALSLVSMLGGTVGGTNVNTIIVVGTYLVIPLLNVAFIAFLKFTQPEV
ncbi:MAG: type II secretion system F family protein, partial [Nanoarchaeota archaeon]|nr:type II secretion system F family protein [Nanoarchaeota archaeon]